MLSQCTFQLCTHHLSLAIRKPPNAKMPYDKRETNACSHSLMQYAALTRCFSSTCSPSLLSHFLYVSDAFCRPSYAVFAVAVNASISPVVSHIALKLPPSFLTRSKGSPYSTTLPWSRTSTLS